jgi:hypothetical protein
MFGKSLLDAQTLDFELFIRPKSTVEILLVAFIQESS